MKVFRICCIMTVQDYLHATEEIEAATEAEAIQKMEAKVDAGEVSWKEECGHTVETGYNVEDQWEEEAA